MLRILFVVFSLFLFPVLSQAEVEILTFDFGFDALPGVLGLTALADCNDLGDCLISSTSGPHSVFRGRGDLKLPITCPGSTFTAAKSINNLRRIVGFCDDGAGTTRGFLRLQNGAFDFLQVPGATSTQALGINDHTRIVGNWRDGTGRFHGFSWWRGVFETIDAPGDGDTLLTGLNNARHIIGFTMPPSGPSQAFVLQDGFSTPLAVPDAVETLPLDINDDDEIVGVWLRQDGTIGSFLFNGTDYRAVQFAHPEALQFDVAGITNTGMAVGRILVPSATPGELDSRGFLVGGIPFGVITEIATALKRAAPVAPLSPARWCGQYGPSKLRGLLGICPEEKK